MAFVFPSCFFVQSPIEDVLLTGKAGHLGLAGMRERAISIGGSVNIATLPQSGTVVSVVIPVRRSTGIRQGEVAIR
jgi:signal transduction histidine kinase